MLNVRCLSDTRVMTLCRIHRSGIQSDEGLGWRDEVASVWMALNTPRLEEISEAVEINRVNYLQRE